MTKYKWGRGWDVVNEEDGNGTLQKTYIGHMAEVPGANPATGAYAYYATDLIRSTRGLFDANKAQVASNEFTPYGDMFASSGTVSTTHLYTGHDWDSATNLYFAPYRYFSPDIARWISRDPAGFVDGLNLYTYVRGGPASSLDTEGLKTLEDCYEEYEGCAVWARLGRTSGDRRRRWVFCAEELAKCHLEVALEKACELAEDHPVECAAVGTLVVIGGVLYIVTTGGDGGLRACAIAMRCYGWTGRHTGITQKE